MQHQQGGFATRSSILQTIQIFKAMTKPKIRSLALGSLSNAEYINFVQQVADLIPSAKKLHVAESVVISYNANIAKMAYMVSHLSENDCTAIRMDMDDQYEDITATVDASALSSHRKRSPILSLCSTV